MIFKKHYPIFILAFIIGCFSLFPQLIGAKRLGSSFEGIYKTINDDSIYYLARAKDIQDGHPTLTNPYLFEHKHDVPMQFWIPDYLLTKPLLILGIDPVRGYIAYSFILPFFLALVIYALCLRLTSRRLLALVAVVLINGGIFLSLFHRIPSPGFNFFFLLGFIYYFIAFIQERGRTSLILSTVLFASLFYIYPYYWTYAVVLLGIFIVGEFIYKKSITRELVKQYSLMFAGAFILIIPYLIEQYKSTKLASYRESLRRLGMLQTHFPSGIAIVVTACFLLAIFLYLWKKNIIPHSSLTLFVGSLILAALVSVNQHIITGKNLEFSSHYWPQSAVFFVLAGLYITKYFVEAKLNNKYKNPSFVTCITIVLCLAVAHGAPIVIAESRYTKDEIYWQNYAPVFSWLNTHTEKDSVVYADDILSMLIPVYTSNNIYYGPFANLFFMSDNETEQRFIVSHYWNNFSKNFITTYEREIWGTHFVNDYNHNQSKNALRKIIGWKPVQYARFSDSEINRVISDAHVIQKQQFKDVLKKSGYKVDYLVWDKNKDTEWKPDAMPFLKPVFVSGNVVVYQVTD